MSQETDVQFSGDIELNPGPVFLYDSVQNNSPTIKLSSNVVLEQMLRCYQLKYLYYTF
jgi:hypothetical protein